MCCISCRTIGNNLPFDKQKLASTSPLPVFQSPLKVYSRPHGFNSIMELQSGQIEIDGMNIRNMGLDLLRR
jgi:hypothetical protein